jgi:hypothetical protein
VHGEGLALAILAHSQAPRALLDHWTNNHDPQQRLTVSRALASLSYMYTHVYTYIYREREGIEKGE